MQLQDLVTAESPTMQLTRAGRVRGNVAVRDSQGARRSLNSQLAFGFAWEAEKAGETASPPLSPIGGNQLSPSSGQVSMNSDHDACV